MTASSAFPRQGDKQNSAFFEEYLLRLLDERDRVGLTDMIHEIDAIMITVDPGHSIRYIGELCLMTPYSYLVTLESGAHWTHIAHRSRLAGFSDQRGQGRMALT